MSFESHELPRGNNEFEQRYKYSIDPSIVITNAETVEPKPASDSVTYHIKRFRFLWSLDCSEHGRLHKGAYGDRAEANVMMVKHNNAEHDGNGYRLVIEE